MAGLYVFVECVSSRYFNKTKQKSHLGNYPALSLEILSLVCLWGAQWLSGRVLDSRPKGSGFEPHQCHCVVVLEQDTFILAKYWLNPGRTVPHN